MHRNTKRAAKITALAATAATALMRPPPWPNAAQPVCSTEPGTRSQLSKNRNT
jgi:hypothetical protein